MKLVTKLLSVVVLFVLIFFTATLFIGNEDLVKDLTKNVMNFLKINSVSLITICASTLILVKEEKSSIIKLITFYMIISLIMSALILFIDVKSINPKLALNIIRTYNLFISLHNIMLVYVLIKIVDINNPFSNIFKTLSIITVFANVGSKMYIIFNNWFGKITHETWDLMDYRILAQTGNGLMVKVSEYSIIILILFIFLIYLTNYAFTTEYLVNEDNMDIDDLRNKANDKVKEKMDNLYQDKKEKIVYEKTETANMNINNQLNYNSTVGQVNSQAKEINISNNSLDSVFTNSGPVINKNTTSNEIKNEDENNDII